MLSWRRTMRITSKSNYALKLLVDIAEHRESGFVPLADIAERQSISKKYLEQIVPMLIKGGLLRASRGNRGGYMLAVSPDRCSIGDILRATEGCVLSFTIDPDDVFQFVWKDVQRDVEKCVDRITLQDIIQNKNGCYDYCI